MTTTLTTEIGILKVTPTDGAHIFVCSRPLNVEPVVINGVEYYLSALLWNIGDVFSLRKSDDLYLSRGDFKPASAAARKKAWHVIVEAVNAWLRTNPQVLVDAQARYIAEQTRRRTEKIAELRAQIATLEEEITGLLDENARVSQPQEA